MEEILSTCRQTWRRLGVKREAADQMAQELQDDLEAAIADGISPEHYVGRDVRAFATEWAEERHLVRPQAHLALTALAAVLGAFPGAVFGLFVAYGLASDPVAEAFGHEVSTGQYSYYSLEPPPWLLLLLYGLGALISYAGALAAVHAGLSWRFDLAASRTLRLMALCLPLCVIGAIIATMVFAYAQNYATTQDVILQEGIVALTTFVLGVATVRFIAVHEERRRLRIEV